jgi:hypothetical protein
MKTYWGVDVQIHVFLTSAVAGGELSASHPSRFTPGESAPGTHWIGGWVGPRTSLINMEKRKFLTLPGLELRPLRCQPIASRYTDWTIPAPNVRYITVFNFSNSFMKIKLLQVR